MTSYKSNIQKLDSPWRRSVLPPKETLLSLGLTAQTDVADIGCGIGYFTFPAAEFIGPNHVVYAIDPSEEMIEEISKRAESACASNIAFIHSEPMDFKLPKDAVGFVLLANVFHEIEEKIVFLDQINKILKSEGHVILIEWNQEVREYGPPLDHRITEADTDQLFVEAGFQVVMKKEIGGHFFGRLYQKC